MNAEILALILFFHLGSSSSFEIFLFKSLEGCKLGFQFQSSTTAFFQTKRMVNCARSCSEHPQCLGFNFCRNESSASVASGRCQLVSQWNQDSCSLLSSAPGCSFRQMDIPCVHGNVNGITRRCDCLPGYAGTACERLIKDCSEGMGMGMTGVDETALIQPLGAPAPFQTRCNFKYGLTAVISRDSSCSGRDAFFYGTWENLKGPRKTDDCYFIGLDNFYHLLNQGVTYTFSAFVMYNSKETFEKIYYPNVQMLNTSGRYTLTWGNPYTWENPAQDGFLPGGNRKFCSLDHDCSGCAAGAGHAGWFEDSGAGCQEAKGLGHPLQWPVGGSTMNIDYIIFEVWKP